jgi:hypothetical protein
MSKILNVRLPDASGGNYDPQKFNQLVRSLEQVILQLNSTYTPVTSENTQAALSWFEAGGGQCEMNSGSSTPVSIGGTNTDAFGRLRVSNPFTLFDSSHRYADNNLWSTATTGTASATFVANEGLVNLTVGTASGDQVIRETIKVFPYQPGKSLLVMSTFVMGAAKAGLRQRVGYYGNDNGFYVERDGTTVYLVERSLVTGASTNTRVAQADWNQDPLNGAGPSGITLDMSKSQIMYMDIEWLGLGTVRMGFIIDGVFVPAHNFDHANLTTTTYITTASLPMRYEIANTASTASASTLKQVCSTVISEGGYTLAGLQQSIGTPITTPKTLTTAGTYYPVVSLRLKATRLDAIIVLTASSILALTNNVNYEWRVVASGTTTGGTWVSAGTDSGVEYNITGTSFAGGRVLASGYTQGSNQGASTIDILKEALFANQLERNGLTATPYELTLIASASSNSSTIHASFDWEEISR